MLTIKEANTMTIFEIMQTTSALSGLACLILVLFATKKQLRTYARR